MGGAIPTTGPGGSARNMTALSAKPTGSLSPAAFVAKWTRVDLPERAASQEHFIDLCRLLGQPTSAEHDATGAEYAFERDAEVVAGTNKGAEGDRGFADVS